MATKRILARIAAGALIAAAASTPLVVSGSHSTGHTNWTNNCAGCHGSTPANPQYNAAGTDSGTLDYVITQVGSMSGLSGLSSTVRNSIAQYIATVLPSNATSATVAANGSVLISVAGTLSLGGVAFTDVRTTTIPTNGTITYGAGVNWASTAIIYEPNTNFVGYDSFTYRGWKSGTTTADSRTMTIKVGGAPVINSATTKLGNVGQFLSYTITATNPATFGISLGTLPAGLSRNGAVISGTPTAISGASVTLSATNVFGSDTQGLLFDINQGTQTITFNAQTTSSRVFSPGFTFSISPLATLSSPNSGNPIVYGSTNSSICTVSGTTVTMVAGGTCTITANVAGNTNYTAAAQKTQSVSITPATQTITFNAQTTPSRNYVQGGTFAISPLATTTSGLAITYSSGTTGVCTVSGTTVTMVSAGTCTIRANQSGNASYSAATQKTQNVTINAVVPAAPTGVGATAGDTTASISFTPPTNTGGAAISSYTVTCSPSGSVSGAGSPLVVTSLTNGQLYSCSVRAQNSAGLGAASSSVNVTPSATPVAPTITSANNTTFTVLSLGSFNVTASGVPTPTYSVFSGSLPSGVTLNSATGVLSGTPASGTAASSPFVVTLRATNTQGTNNQTFTLNVIKANQTITFEDPDDQAFSLATTPLTASSTSGLAIAFTTATPSVCTISGGTNVALVSIGTCTINANQAGNTNYNAAGQVQQSFDITKGDQSITFNAQTTATRQFNGGTFPIAPVATASSGLAVTYTSTSPTVCTVSGTTVTMVNVGTCTLQADQAGNGNWNAASPETQDVTLTQGSQVITFNAQAAQPFSAGGTFSINPVATSTSGLAISYTSTTQGVCTISGTTVTIVSAGTCTIAANQAGNTNYAAAPQVTQNITINAALPGAPTIGTAAALASGQLQVSFTAPANTGGTTITSYTVTCNPGGFTGTGSGSPITVSGLTNGQSYSCSVTATNSAGTGPASATTNGTPSASGPATWASVCSACHGATPAGARFNAAGTTTAVLDYVIANQPEMAANSSITSLTAQQRQDLVAYITSFLEPVVQTVAPNTAKSISVGGHLTIGSTSFNQVEVVSAPASGTLGAFSGANALYTPAPGFTGSTTFTYRGRRNSPIEGNPPILLGDVHTATINVDPNARVLTVAVAPGAAGLVVISGPDGSTFCSSNCVETFQNGNAVTMFAAPEAGFIFTGWSGSGCSGVDQCDVTMDANKSVTATFVADNLLLSVSKSGAGTGTVTSNPAGIDCGATCSASFASGSNVLLTATPTAGHTFTGWTGAGCSGTGTCNVTMSSAQSVTASFAPPAPGALSGAPNPLNFGGQSMGTSSPAMAATFTNTGGTSVSVSNVSTNNSQFTQTNNCTNVAPGASCTVNVTFTPAAQAGAVNSEVGVPGTLTLTHNGTGGSSSITLAGTGEKSLITHYYRAILRRAPDAGGKAFWQSESNRMVGLNTNVNEAWYSMATFFFFSSEYTALNRDNTGFVTDLYNTFFNRAPDGGGLAFWVGQLNQGMPREVVLVSFMLSTEFVNFTQAIFGNTAARAEVDVVMDFYRGLLSRLPDNGGFANWVNGFRAAQCQGGSAVYAMVEQISSDFATSGEYLGRGRTNGQYVGDLYNAFLRRGGDLAGVQHWINQLNTNAQTREQIRQAFISTPEFNGRANAIIAAGCVN